MEIYSAGGSPDSDMELSVRIQRLRHSTLLGVGIDRVS